MRNLLLFLVRYQNFFITFLLEVICLVLLFNYQYYHRSKALTVAQEVSSGYYGLTSGVRQYFHLKAVNDSLRKANTRLMNKLAFRSAADTNQLGKAPDSVVNNFPGAKIDTFETDTSVVERKQKYHYILARVIYNSVNKRNNYITLDKGSKDGLEAPMGLTTSKGIVGIIKNVSKNYAVGISVLHNDFSLSCEIQDIGQIGALTWNGRDPRLMQLEDLPTHVSLSKGQVVVTSPYSRLFPPGLPVGRIVDYSKSPTSNFYDIQVKLHQRLRSLHHVYAIENRLLEEQLQLEKAARP